MVGRGRCQRYSVGPATSGQSCPLLCRLPPVLRRPLSRAAAEGDGGALTGEDPSVPSEDRGSHGEVTVGAVGRLLGFPAGEQQPLDELGLQGGGGTLVGHVSPPGRRRRRSRLSAPPGQRNVSSSPGACPCGALGGAGVSSHRLPRPPPRSAGWDWRVRWRGGAQCVRMRLCPRVLTLLSPGDHSRCQHSEGRMVRAWMRLCKGQLRTQAPRGRGCWAGASV